MITRVKICGITRREDAEAASNEGATAIGFIFVRSSPRYIDPDAARDIIRTLPPFVTPVGVLANSSRSEALALVANTGVRCLQLHEQQRPEEFGDFPVPYYKVIRVSPEFRIDLLKAFQGTTFMLDTFAEGKLGGSGKSFDWKVALQAKKYGRIILSGGINPENVGDAIRRVSPYAVDVSSGVEKTAGKKDENKIRLLFKAIHDADRSAETAS